MATLEQESESRTKLKALLEELSNIDAASLARVTDLGPGLSFESGVLFFSRTLRLFHALHDANLDDIPFQNLSNITSLANQALEQFRNIREFSLPKYPNNPMEIRNQFINIVRDHYDNLFQQVAPVIAFTIQRGTDFEKLEEKGKETLARITSLSADHEQALVKARADAESLVREVRRMAQESGVSQHAVHFKGEADRHEATAKQWLSATIWLAAVTLAFAIAFFVLYFTIGSTLTATQNLQLAISKVIIIFILLSATFWVGRTYRAHRHNAVVNRHRQNALTTFRTFVEATGDEPTKNAVLLQATQCIFSPQQTGYVSSESEPGIPQVLEIVRTLGKSSG